MISVANKMKHFPESIFGTLKQAAANHTTYSIIDLSLGSPDIPPANFLREHLAKQALDASNYGYTLTGTKMFHEAVANYYERVNLVKLDADTEIIQTMGSQEGLVHLPSVFCNPGDIVLTTNPAYVAYDTGIRLADAIPFAMPLKKEHHYLPQLSDVPEDILQKAKLLILNLPGNPVPAMPTHEYFREVIAFAKKYNMIVLHDAAYSEFYFEGDMPISFMQVEGAKEVGLEINSLSKSFSLAGTRIAYIVGNAELISHIKTFKSNLDFGTFLPIQQTAALALNQSEEITAHLRKTFKERHALLTAGLTNLGWEVAKSNGGMFVWAKYPSKLTSIDYALHLIDQIGIVTVPGIAFGSDGEGYVRIALVQSVEKLQEALNRLEKL